MIHINLVHKFLADPKIPFDCKVWKSNGDILHYKNVVCTSTFFAENSATLLFTESRQIRKVRIISIFEINDIEIFI
jgi:hypothetical protein